MTLFHSICIGFLNVCAIFQSCFKTRLFPKLLSLTQTHFLIDRRIKFLGHKIKLTRVIEVANNLAVKNVFEKFQMLNGTWVTWVVKIQWMAGIINPICV